MNTTMMMNAATITPATAPETDLSLNLVNDFLAFIDRSDKTVKTYITNLKQFAAYLKYNNITRPLRNDVISYRDWLKSPHIAIKLAPETLEGWTYQTDKNGNKKVTQCKPSTVKLYLQSVKQFFSWTAASGLYPNIAANIHAPKVKQGIHKKDSLTASEVVTIENSIREKATTEQGKRLLAMYLLTVNAGLRTIELHRANVKDLEIKDGNAALWIWGKGCSEPDQKKPLAPAVYDAIKDYLNSRADNITGSSPLFVSTGNRSHGKRIAVTTISKMLKSAMQDAGFDSERLTAHSLRHTAGTSTFQITDKNIYATQKYMRHADPATTEIYVHSNDAEADADIANKLWQYYHKQQA